MRKHSAPLGWLRHHPRRYRFAVPNEVWEYKLKPIEFVIFSYLCYRQTHAREGKVLDVQEMAHSLHLATATVEKHLAALVSRGLVTKDGTPSLKCDDGKFFTLPNEIFLLALPPSAFLVYAYLLLIEDRRTHTCHPSYKTIAAATGISKNTAIKSIGVLAERELITVEASSYFDKRGMKWKGNNLYTILPISVPMDEFYHRQLRQLELETERSRIQRQQAKLSRCRPTAALCATEAAKTTPDPAPTT